MHSLWLDCERAAAARGVGCCKSRWFVLDQLWGLLHVRCHWIIESMTLLVCSIAVLSSFHIHRAPQVWKCLSYDNILSFGVLKVPSDNFEERLIDRTLYFVVPSLNAKEEETRQWLDKQLGLYFQDPISNAVSESHCFWTKNSWWAFYGKYICQLMF